MDSIPYCPPDVKIIDISSNCFLETLRTFIFAGFIVIFGLKQLYNYWRYATPISNKSSSKLFYFQIILLTLIPSLAIANFNNIYGYTIVVSSLTCFSFLISIWLVLMERFNWLSSAPIQRHGNVLLIFWSLYFINENISMFTLKNGKVSVFRYVCSLLTLILGFIAPGLSSNPIENYVPLEDDKEKKPSKTWTEQIKMYKELLQHFWPRKNIKIQLSILGCLCFMTIERFIVALTPIYNQNIVDNLGEKVYCWDVIVIYVCLEFLESGFLYYFHTFLWDIVEHFLEFETEIKIFSRLQNLSLRWHLGRNTGKVLSHLERGGSAVTNLTKLIIFRIVPEIIDVISSLVILSVVFNWYFGLILIAPICLYAWLSILETQWQNQSNEDQEISSSDQRERCIDSLINFETVKYCGAEKYEIDTFYDATKKCQKEGRTWKFHKHLMDTAQSFIIYGTLLIGSLFCAYLVADVGSLSTGQYIFIVSHITHVYRPLNYVIYLYGELKYYLKSVEKLSDLLNEKEEIVDEPDAMELCSVRGDIEFSNVTFGYTPDELVLKNISFSIAAGKTLAFVGQSGAGKSTIMRLLFRFFDVLGGIISIDGHNIKNVTQRSLRQAIGVVPQDTILFNSSIKDNIKYGRLDASDDDIIEAARAAEIHDKIMKFTDKYDTEVGEMGLRLSGGEKQRVAIARTILKAPPIMLLDEATSALDTQTERNIQGALAKVCANRTTIIVAHRLSTVIHADEIIVLKDGEIAERGRHNELLRKNGIYADMWNTQLNCVDKNSNDTLKTETREKSDLIVH